MILYKVFSRGSEKYACTDSITVTGIHEPLVTVTHSTVLRDGKWRDIPATFLAKGDLVGLGEGDMTPSRMECVEPGKIERLRRERVRSGERVLGSERYDGR